MTKNPISEIDSLSTALEIEPILEVNHLSKHYGPLVALEDVSLQLFPGEVLALVGDNGAGKSTLLKILSGNLAPSHGEIRVKGAVKTFGGPSDASSAGVATVYQDLAIALDLDIASNIFLGREIVSSRIPGKWFGWLDRAEMRRQTQIALDEIHSRIPNIRLECGSLSGGQRQAVAVARAVKWCRDVILLDEPTAALGVEQQREVLSLIERISSNGTSVILVSHQLPHVMEVADRIAVLRQGRLTAVINKADVTVERLVGLITGLEGDFTNDDLLDMTPHEENEGSR